ncbi:putative ankyrin repeat-containing protein ITN1 [Cocos nucifera]|uniref:Putative ankyrin repeat-containing protein ITN1 n=1 Tax=Cocos nucifera TaxID=13894 RepID=A0A8K0N3J6_COCNU|nr:putative ankyrin repeat-containing protein ITN1 [Cocos nucifera]
MEDVETEDVADHIKEMLFKRAMQGMWKEVAPTYAQDKKVRKTKMTWLGDTLLHLAATSGVEENVMLLMACLQKEDEEYGPEILEIQNERGETALHIAAALGMVDVCLAMARLHPRMVVDNINVHKETPLFTAVIHGQKRAFFALQSVVDEKIYLKPPPRVPMQGVRREGGDTILHNAIFAEQFDLALEIVYRYPDLVNARNEKGELPLHVLANKPSVFESGTRFGPVDSVIYRHISVDPLKVKHLKVELSKNEGIDDGSILHDGNHKIPDNYQACYNIFILLKHVFKNIAPWTSGEDDKSKHTTDVEIPDAVSAISTIDKGDPVSTATPLLVAAKTGVVEMVEKILEETPTSVFDLDQDEKNIVLLAAEYGHIDIYDRIRMLEKNATPRLFGRVDKQGNSALHLAANLVRERLWSIPGAAFQIQSEVKWYKYIEKSVGPGYFPHYNFERKTAQEIFADSHKDLIKDAQKWFISTSTSCSVVAALIATVVYTSFSTVPGGNNQDTGFPIFQGQPAFQVFAISSLIALCFSVMALFLFLSILTSRFHESDFVTGLPTKLILGITTFFVSIAANLVSFFAGHFYIIHNKLESGVYYLYAGMSILVIGFFFMSQPPLYIDLLRTRMSERPKRSKKLHYF